jgi:GrpB-like predicted nucleotidyltransferase (UPF0157 family)
MSLVVVSPYSNEWPNLFRNLKDNLIRLFAPISITVEHIGSTSVPGLAAKPVIDVLIGAASLADIESKIDLLSEHGYEYVSKYEKEIPDRRYFVKSSANSLRVHIHAVELGSRIWQEHLAFRDALRSDISLRAQYQSLKLQLAEQFVHNKSAYSAAKNPFIESVLAAALGR